MSPDPIQPPLNHHNLRSGSVDRIARPYGHPLQGAVAMAVDQSLREPAPFGVEGTEFAIVANMSTHENGNAGFSFLTANPIGNGRVPAESIMYSGAVACHLPTAPLAWRHIVQKYLREVAMDPPMRFFCALSFMPKTMPWVTGFTTANSDALTKEERANLLTLVRLAAMILLQRCERACEEAAMAGTLAAADSTRFPELLDEKD